jgi:hypothetical protein
MIRLPPPRFRVAKLTFAVPRYGHVIGFVVGTSRPDQGRHAMQRAGIGLAIAVLSAALASPASAQSDPPPWRRVSDQYYARVQECWARYAKHQLKTFSDATNCGDTGAIQEFEQSGYPAMEFVRFIITQNAAIAERVMRGKITATKGIAERASVELQVATEIQRRKAAYQQSVEQNRAIQQQQGSADAEANLRQAQAAAAADEQQQQYLARFAAGMLAPTRTGSFSESLGNGFGAAAGLPPPAQPTTVWVAPSQTTCFRAGPQVICNTQ